MTGEVMSADASTHGYFVVSRITLAAVATAPSIARAFVDHHLRRWGLTQRADDARLIVSELAANAVEATGIPQPNPAYPVLEDLALIGVQLGVHGGVLVLDVWDSSPEVPARREVDDQSVRGRGLNLVEALSDNWGVWRTSSHGKVVFAELTTEPPTLPTTSPNHMALPRRTRQALAGHLPAARVVEEELLERILEKLRTW